MPLSFIVRALAIGLLLHLYVGYRIVPALTPWPAAEIGMIVWLAASYVLIPLGMMARRARRDDASTTAWAGLLTMGLFSSLLVLCLLRDVVLVVALSVALLAHTSVPVLWRDLSGVAVPVLALVFSVVGFVNARRRARIKHVDVPIDDLPSALDGFRIAQISDIHVGPTIRQKYVDAIVDAVNDLHADVIAITGDVVDGGVEQLSAHTRPLGRLHAEHGVYLVTGNHEYYSGAHAWVEEFRRIGLNVLLNEHVVIRHGGVPVVIAGVTDYSGGHFDPAHESDPTAALAGAPADATVRLLLAHQPRSAHAAADAGYTLQLSGHTHGGQFFPWNFFVRVQQPFTAGLNKVRSLWVYTSRGTGYWGPPKRLFAPSEITLVRLVHGASRAHGTRGPAPSPEARVRSAA
ncbi:metallophosphoesterase [Pararobbsia silviterrae]|uniref:Metallophosphoesterase n=1 Tax=Pararobbsia silviterrae TaxID=1792498 RepID=A0A494XV37_9BURK|nr:metallophosphoesterase [Pararobbsia silviterrae]RKP51929.1 metallophosphoesterase [Pararobbsia silviterrae]